MHPIRLDRRGPLSHGTVVAMKFAKSPPWLIERFDELTVDVPGERRQMFGYPCGFLNGQLFCGLFAASMFVRLGEVDRQKLLAVEGARVFEPMAGRPMREYVVVPDALIEDSTAVRGWLDRAASYASSLPPKAKKSAGRQPAAKKPPAKRRPNRA